MSIFICEKISPVKHQQHLNFNANGYIGTDKHKENFRSACIKGNQAQKEKAKQKEFFKMKLYEANSITCKQCGNPHEYKKRNNKFCSRTCSAIFNNTGKKHSEQTKEKIKKTLSIKNNIKEHQIDVKYKNIEKYDLNPKSCLVCRNKIEYDKRKNKSCDNEMCRKTIQSIAGRTASSYIKKRSKDEIELFELCQSLNILIYPNEIIADGWDADITFPDLKIAILWNGPWHYKEMNMKNHSLKQVQNRDKLKIKLFESLGWKVLIFEDRYYTPESAFEIVKEMVGVMGIEPTSFDL